MLTRRTLLQGIIAGGAAAGASARTRSAAATTITSTDVVDMEAVVKAACWDPVPSTTHITPGAAPSVLAVEQALVAQGLLAPSYADGSFGSMTVKAYAAYQASLGYTGLAANGLPGRASLTKLGVGRFGITRPVSPGTKVLFRGVTITTRTRAMLLEAEKHLTFQLPMEQGSYNPGGDPTSKGSHDGGGVVDVHAVELTTTQRVQACTALRKVGFAAWIRNPAQDNWPWHIHAVAINDTDLAPLAQKQVGQYYEGRNALASNLPDDGPTVRKVTWEEFLRNPVW